MHFTYKHSSFLMRLALSVLFFPTVSNAQDYGKFLESKGYQSLTTMKDTNRPQEEFLRSLVPSSNDFNLAMGADGAPVGDDVVRSLTGTSTAPIAQYSIRIDPELSPTETESALARHGLVVLDAAEWAGIASVAKVVGAEGVEPNSAEFFQNADDALFELRGDPSFLSVAPELSLSGQELYKFELSLGPMPFGDESRLGYEYRVPDSRSIDWSMQNIEAPPLWEMVNQGKAVGVLDVGFGEHQDIPYWDLARDIPRSNHGNHVAGIMCAKHNSFGINGVLPSCLVVAQVPKFSQYNDQFGVRATSMAAVLNAFRRIVYENEKIKVVNVSLGYNWRQRFDILQLDDERKQDVADLASQIIEIYEIARDRDIFIVSAAGNDSWDLDPKLNAAWASPMNFASIAFCQEFGLCNGVVVEAHDKTDHHADFSNVGGHLSCPGVDILSAVAFDEANASSKSHYALTSGTSMASPFCAAGLVLLSTLRPKYQAKDLIYCAIESGRKTGDFSAPALDLAKALEHCPLR